MAILSSRARRAHLVRWVVGFPAAAGLLAATATPVPSAPRSGSGGPTPLEARILRAVQDARFDWVVDFGPFEDVCPGASFCASPAGRIPYVPNVDVAVIELDAQGRALNAANVLVSRDYPDGVVVPVDRAGGPAGSYGTSSVRWRRWDIDRYNGGTFDQSTGVRVSEKGWTENPPLTDDDDIVDGRQRAPLQFMAPYPASLFKLVVAFRVMRLVDSGQLSLTQKYTYLPASEPLPGAAAKGEEEMDQRPLHGRAPRVSPKPVPGAAETRAVRDWMEPMITVSDNRSARALLKLLHDRDDLPAMHAELRSLGLSTLQISGTDPRNGRNWQPGQIHMTSLDTARLLWLIEGGADTLWTQPDGQPVRASMLSNASRAYLKALLDAQGFHEALSTSNLCGADHVEPGIPARVPARWIDPNDGTVSVDGFPYGRDVRPCNAAAEVVFGHKTGLTFNYGSNAGIVRSLPGSPERRYVISFLSSLGYRYTDSVFAGRSSYPCYDAVGPICYTQKIPALGRQLDDYLRSAP